MVKKKFLGGYGLLFGVLCCLFVGFLSTSCYARTTLTDDEAQYLYNYLFQYSYGNSNNLGSYLNFAGSDSTSSEISKTNVFSDGWQSFKTQFNAINTLDIDPNSTIFWCVNWGWRTDLSLYYGNFNNGKTGELPYLYIRFRQNYPNQIALRVVDDNGVELSSYQCANVRVDLGTSSVTVRDHNGNYNPNNFTVSDDSSSNWRYWLTKNNSWNVSNLQNNALLLENIPGIVSFSNTNSIFTNYNGQSFLSTPQFKFLQTLYSGGGTPPSPEPDIPEDTGNTGQITDNQGQTTGNIDLSGIQNGIGQINQSINEQGQAIIENQNQNTEQIVNALTNSETEQDTESTEEQFEDMISSTANVVDPTTNIFSWLIDNLRSILNDTGNYNLPVTIFNTTYVIRSDYFVLPDGDFKTFLQLAFISWFGWAIIKKIHYIVYAVKCVNLSSVMNATDFNANIL